MKSFGLFLLCAVCSAFVSARAAAQPPRSQSAAELTGAAAGPQYAGRPLRFWIEQSKASDRADARKAVEALVLALEGASLADMVAAADALEAMGPEARAAAPALARKLDHKQPWVRIASMNALKAIGPEAVPWVVEVYEKGSPAARQRAASVLGAMGPKARSALPALRKSLGRASPGERAQIEEVLAQIGERGDGPGPSQEAARPDAAGLSRSEGLPRGEADSDWPQFHGPRRDSICRETGLLTTWPAGGPKLLWKREGMGRAYSSVSIARGRLFTMGDRRDGPGESQFVIALDLATQKDLWATRIGPPHDDGPRCTPTVDGDRVYALGTEGDLLCLDAATGKVLWRRSLAADFDGKMMSGWKYSESPLVDGPRLVCTPGGPGATVVALDKHTGALVWKCPVPELGPKGRDGAAYSSAIVAEIEGVRQCLQVLGRGVVAIEASSGRYLWGYNAIANTTASITHPIARGNHVFVTNGYNAGSALLRIVRKGDAFHAEEVYTLSGRTFQNHHGGVVLVGDYVYGGSGQNAGEPVCIELATGRVAWRARPPERGSAAVLYADGHVVFRYDRGLVALVEAAPDGFRLKGSFQPVAGDGPAWPHPVIHQGKLYLRQNDVLACYDLRESRD